LHFLFLCSFILEEFPKISLTHKFILWLNLFNYLCHYVLISIRYFSILNFPWVLWFLDLTFIYLFIYLFVCFFFLYIIGGSGVWTQGLALAKQVLYNFSRSVLSHLSHPFCVVYFWNTISFYDQSGLGHNPPICPSPWNWDDSCSPNWAIGWDTVFQTFCPGWPWTTILLISTSW
jgi:hypothetical protein